MDDLPGVRVQLLHGPVQGQPALPLLRLLRWIVGGGLTGQGLLLQGNVPLPPLQLLVPQPLGDGAQPYLRRAVPAEGAQLSEGLAEGLLAQLLRQVIGPMEGILLVDHGHPGTGGIGLHLCEGFQRAGYAVTALDVEQHKALPDGIGFIQTDLRQAEAVNEAFRRVTERHGAVHVLVNNAALAHFHKPVMEMTADEFDNALSVNLRGAFLCAQAFIKANAGQDYGRIINIASTRWNQNEAGWEAYGASKGGLVSLTNALAVSDKLEQLGVETEVFTSITMPQVAPAFTRKDALKAMADGKIAIFGGGTGNPFFSTDTTTALRAVEVSADIMFKATMVDGVYDKDPHKYPDAKKYDTLTFTKVLEDRLAVMDGTAATLCRDNKLPILVFDLADPDNIAKAVQGENVGTLVYEG